MQISQRFSVYPCDDGTNIIYDEENEIIFARVISKNVASAVCKELNLIPEWLQEDKEINCSWNQMELYLTYLGVAILINIVSVITTGEPFMLTIS